MAEHKTDDIIPEQVKTTIGRLIVVVAAEGDAAKKLNFMSSLLGEVSSALKMLILHWQIHTTNSLLWDLIQAMVVSEIKEDDENHTNYKRAMMLVKRLNDKFDPEISVDKNRKPISQESNQMALLVLKDWYAIEACFNRWKVANDMYHTNNQSWGKSNAMLADIFKSAVDVANRNHMIIIPKNTYFNISELQGFANFGAHTDEEGERRG